MKMPFRAALALLAASVCAPAMASQDSNAARALAMIQALQAQVATLSGGGLSASAIAALPTAASLTGPEIGACVQSGQLVQCNPALQSAYTLGLGITGLGAANAFTGTEVGNWVQTINGVATPVRAPLSAVSGFTLTTGVTGATAATSLAGTEAFPAVKADGTQTRANPAQIGGYVFGTTMPALTAASTAAGSEGVPLVQNVGGVATPVLGSINGSIAPNSRPNIYNYTPQSLLKWRAALAKAVIGQASAKLVFFGDSLTAGAGAGTGGTTNTNGAFTRGFPYWMSKLLPATTAGVPVTYEAIFGDHTIPDTGSAAVAAYYGNVTFSGTTDWTRSTSTFGGNALQNPSANGNGTITITPRSPIDTVDVWSLTSGSSGSFTVSDANGTMCTVNAASGAAYKKNTCTRISGGPSTLPITLAKSATGDLGIGGFDMYNSTVPSIRIINAGAYGQTAVTEGSTSLGYSPLSALKAYAPDMCVVLLLGNDYRNSVAVASSQTAVTNIVQGCQLTGSALLVWLGPDSSYSDAVRAPYRAAMLAVAQANGVPMLDLTERAGSYAAANAAGFKFDSVHETQAGYFDDALAMLPLIRP